MTEAGAGSGWAELAEVEAASPEFAEEIPATGLVGARAARQLGQKRGVLNTLFAGLIFVVAIYMLVRNFGAF